MKTIHCICLLERVIGAIPACGIGYESQCGIILLCLKKQEQFGLNCIRISRVEAKDWTALQVSVTPEWR